MGGDAPTGARTEEESMARMNYVYGTNDDDDLFGDRACLQVSQVKDVINDGEIRLADEISQTTTAPVCQDPRRATNNCESLSGMSLPLDNYEGMDELERLLFESLTSGPLA